MPKRTSQIRHRQHSQNELLSHFHSPLWLSKWFYFAIFIPIPLTGPEQGNICFPAPVDRTTPLKSSQTMLQLLPCIPTFLKKQLLMEEEKTSQMWYLYGQRKWGAEVTNQKRKGKLKSCLKKKKNKPKLLKPNHNLWNFHDLMCRGCVFMWRTSSANNNEFSPSTVGYYL